jgi:hypothetical protein
MKRPLAILLTTAIVCGIPAGITLLTGLVTSDDTTGVVGVLVGSAFGMFALDLYRVLRDKRGVESIG